MDIRLLRLRSAGMFSNVNEVIQQLHLAERHRYGFVIDWSASCYLDPDRDGDPWSYYFEPCCAEPVEDAGELPVLPGGSAVVYTRDNVITPRLANGVRDPLLLPADRHLAHRIIERHIRLDPRIQDIVDGYRREHLDGHHVIGLHLRGPGRSDGGANLFRRPYATTRFVPFSPSFQLVDAHLAEHPEARILACSDSTYVIDGVRERYGDRVLSYDATRTDFGEMHASRLENQDNQFSPYALGEDVVVEAYLLSTTDFFVHGNSNVANFVLCNNPDLRSRYIFAAVATRSRLWRMFWRQILSARLETARRRVRRYGRGLQRWLADHRR
jgi:hypothetical protein